MSGTLAQSSQYMKAHVLSRKRWDPWLIDVILAAQENRYTCTCNLQLVNAIGLWSWKDYQGNKHLFLEVYNNMVGLQCFTKSGWCDGVHHGLICVLYCPFFIEFCIAVWCMIAVLCSIVQSRLTYCNEQVKPDCDESSASSGSYLTANIDGSAAWGPFCIQAAWAAASFFKAWGTALLLQMPPCTGFILL